MDVEQWPGEWIRGVLPLCLLAVVAEDETYGYEVARRLQAAGLGKVKGGTLYPALTRLEDDGLVRSSWREGDGGPGRKFFSITPEGREFLTQRRAGWTTFTERAGSLLHPERTPS